MNSVDEAKQLTRRSALKLGVAAGGLMLGSGLLAGCSSGSNPSRTPKPKSTEKVTLTFWDSNAGPERTPYWKELISRFEAQNPRITVTYVGLPVAQAPEKIQAAIASGAVPDVAYTDSGTFAGLVAQDGLLPLDSYYSKWNAKDEIPAKLIASARTAVANNKLYGIPMSQNTTILYYRKDWFQQHGLKAPTTWDDFYNAAKALTDESNGVYGFGLRGAAGSTDQLLYWVFAESGITSYYTSKGKSTLDEPPAVDVIEKAAGMYGKYTSKGDLSNTYPQMVAEFDGGHAAMIMHNLGSSAQHIQALGKDAVGAVPLPPAKSGKNVVVSYPVRCNTVFKGSKHPDEAFTFASFLSSAASDSYFNEKIGQAPTNSKAAAASWVKDNVAISNGIKTIESPNTVLVNPPIYLPEYATLDSQMDKYFQEVLQGTMTAKEYATQLAASYTSAKKSYDKAHPSK